MEGRRMGGGDRGKRDGGGDRGKRDGGRGGNEREVYIKLDGWGIYIQYNVRVFI